MLNKAILIGNIGKDIELRYTPSGKAVCNVSLATTRNYKGEKHTTWHNVVMWDKSAENTAKYCSKGSKICVEGMIENTQYTDREGNTRYKSEIIAHSVLFLSVNQAKREEVQDQETNAGIQPDDDLPF